MILQIRSETIKEDIGIREENEEIQGVYIDGTPLRFESSYEMFGNQSRYECDDDGALITEVLFSIYTHILAL